MSKASAPDVRPALGLVFVVGLVVFLWWLTGDRSSSSSSETSEEEAETEGGDSSLVPSFWGSEPSEYSNEDSGGWLVDLWQSSYDAGGKLRSWWENLNL